MQLVSEFRVFPNRNGRKMAAFWDHMDPTPHDAPFVILAPKFGESKKNNIQAAYYLARNGLNVFRFDHLDHPGESDGEIADYTFAGATRDILEIIDYLEREFRAREVIVMANSMSARPGIRAAARDSRVARFISLVGMVNFQSTSKAVYREDMVDLHLRGQRIGSTDILGHEVDASRFLEGTIRENMHDLTGTLQDVQEATSDFFFICGDKDHWVDPDDMRTLEQRHETLKIRWVPGAMHELRENPHSAELAFREAVFACRHGRFSRSPEELDQIAVPDQAQVMEQNRLERNRLRLANPLTRSESSFWNEYLGKYGILEHIQDFQYYVQLLVDVLGPLGPEDCILDAGCGNGLVGNCMIRHVRKQQQPAEQFHPLYFGLDLTEHGLGDAMGRHAASHFQPGCQNHSPLNFQYLKYNLEVVGKPGGTSRIQLPFESETFDKICCSLLLSYLRRPETVLAECYRLLVPGGRIALSSMKPFCDLSSLYTKLLDETPETEILHEARELLSAAGTIRLKEEQGHYTFYSRGELTVMAETAGFREIQYYRTFGNQANLIIARK